eukprot:1314272-Prymnesium_polylepis.1
MTVQCSANSVGLSCYFLGACDPRATSGGAPRARAAPARSSSGFSHANSLEAYLVGTPGA